ncbi:MAG TPA: TetR/AcrR family transcriptional regulator, partial [Pseudomonadales bacterium]|nr:TetR/AcrR family transcriptional regulator [Pseudomonadales bacterium]
PQQVTDSHPKSRNELKAQTRARIIDATIEALIEEGHAGLSMNKIAKRAGIAQPSFYVHFENLDQLFEAVAATLADRYIRPLQHSLESVMHTLKPEETRGLIERMFGVGFDIVRQQKALYLTLWTERDQPKSALGQHIRNFYHDCKDGWTNVLLNVGLVENSEPGRLKLRLFMDGVFALFECYTMEWIAGRYTDEQPLIQSLTDYVMHYWER